MQTFPPFPDFKRSAEILDRARLGKQRCGFVEENWEIVKISWEG